MPGLEPGFPAYFDRMTVRTARRTDLSSSGLMLRTCLSTGVLTIERRLHESCWLESNQLRQSDR
jgi:hypothetical protein